MKKLRKAVGIICIFLGICLLTYPDISTRIQEAKVRRYVKNYECRRSREEKPLQGYGYIRIPKRDVILPLYIGDSEEHLEMGAAILKETGFPGKKNHNCIIAAHRGYRGKPYFREIERLKKGDLIYVRIPEKELVYIVKAFQIIRPEETEKIKMLNGEDQITLLTCHPYRGNGKYRYLVYAVRKSA